MSYDEFVAWDTGACQAEWVKGETTIFKPPTTIHQSLMSLLNTLLVLYTDMHSLGKVLTAPFEMRHLPGQASREPDILFIATANNHRLTANRLEGAADIVMEIVSPSSVIRDYQDKRIEYQQAGIREYWIIDPRQGSIPIHCYHLSPQGHYDLAKPDDQGRYHSAIVRGFWLHPTWISQRPLPAAHTLLLKMCGETYITYLIAQQQATQDPEHR
jgi:Uma2 family endonuclease